MSDPRGRKAKRFFWAVVLVLVAGLAGFRAGQNAPDVATAAQSYAGGYTATSYDDHDLDDAGSTSYDDYDLDDSDDTSSYYAADDDVIVYITDTGERYHRFTCRSLRYSCYETPLSDAIDAGYTPCRVCHPPTG